MNKNIFEKIDEYADLYGIPRNIVRAMCQHESSFNPYAVRYEPHYKWFEDPTAHKPRTCSISTEIMLQKTSWGLMQVMGGVFRQYGYSGWLTAVASNLDIQLQFGCKHLFNKMSVYGEHGGILAYNRGTAKRDASGSYIDPDGYLTKIMLTAERMVA